LGRALAKPHLRVIGVDDGPFTRRHHYAPVVAVALSQPGTVEGVLATRVRVDGRDATDQVIALLGTTPHLAGARAILLDGISFGGFNLIDLDRLHRALGRPVISVTRRPPDFPAIRAALSKYFPKEFRARWRLVRRHQPFAAPTAGRPLWVAAVGATREQARLVVRRTTVVGYWPEPLRLAHMVARAIAERGRTWGVGARGRGTGRAPPAARSSR
jgi:endonuclease V-like protein UPF0215 family